MRRATYILLSAGLAALLLTGCAANLASKKRIDTKLPAGSRIAVLPFENLSGTDRAAEKVTEYFVMALTTADRLETLEYGSVYEAMRRYRIRSASLLNDMQIDSLAAFLRVDYLVSGSVLEFKEEDDVYLGTVPQVSFNTRVIDCRSHRTVWVGSANGRGDRGEVAFGIGTVRSAETLANGMVQDAAGEITDLFESR